MDDIAAPTPKKGDIWREVDQRFERFVEVLFVGARVVEIRTVEKKQFGWAKAPRSRIARAMPERFNGKIGGYELVEAKKK